MDFTGFTWGMLLEDPHTIIIRYEEHDISNRLSKPFSKAYGRVEF